MNQEVEDKVKAIKQSFRLMMNGVASRSMREKGLDYKVNWGVSLPQLKQEALEYGKDFDLAVELFKQDVRECKILATLIMPVERVTPELVDVWMEQTRSQEMAEMSAFNLYQHLDFAPELAYRWLSVDDVIYQIAAYQILSRLFMRGLSLDERGINEFIDQTAVALKSDNAGLRHAVNNCVLRFSELGDEYERIARTAFQSC